jgi:hypothetical protein
MLCTGRSSGRSDAAKGRVAQVMRGETVRNRSDRLGYAQSRKFVLLLVAAAFGPILVPSLGLRTDQLLILFLFVIAAGLLLLLRKNVLGYRSIAQILALLSALMLTTLASTALNLANYGSYSKVLSYTENYLQPIAITIILGVFFHRVSSQDANKIIMSMARLVMFLLAANSIVCILSLFIDMAPVMRHFVQLLDASNPSTWQQSSTGGRFTGVFSEPALSGFCYSLGVLLWMYTVHKEPRPISSGRYVLLLLLFAGGVLSISKAFILGGIPLFFIYAYMVRELKVLATRRLLALVVVAGFIGSYLVSRWVGLNFLLELFTGRSSLSSYIYLFTGTRFSPSGSTVMDLFAYAWSQSPLIGLGFGSAVILDNAFLEYFVQGGIVALLLYVMLIVRLGFTGYVEHARSDEGLFLLFMAIYVVGAGMGGPIITASRYAVLFWTCVFLMLYSIEKKKEETRAIARGEGTPSLESA